MKPRVFIGSSSEARDRGIVDIVVRQLQEFSEPRAWDLIFKINDITIEAIIDQSKVSDFAVFLFCRDDDGLFRGSTMSFPRDNVIFEAGLFISALGRERVFVLAEKGAKIPSDLRGVTLPEFEFPEDPSKQDATMRGVVGRIRESMENASGFESLIPEWRLPDALEEPPPLPTLFGLRHALDREKQVLRTKFLSAYSFLALKNVGEESSFDFFSNERCVEAYVGGLSEVHERYYTTTTFRSGFWTRQNEGAVVQANESMVRRVKSNGGHVCRIFLLDKPLDGYIGELRNTIRSLKENRMNAEVELLRQEFVQVRKKIERQLASGCEVLFAVDNHQDYRHHLPAEALFDPRREEIAIYDSFRFDIFEAGELGQIAAVRSYTPVHRNFATFMDALVHYFEAIKVRAYRIHSVLDRIERELLSEAHRIDYRSQWLVHYEYELDVRDAGLKERELALVRRWLQAAAAERPIRKFLDVGTCTGRYLIAVAQEFLASDGVAIGIDNDGDCVVFAAEKLNKANIANASVQLCDFLVPDLPVSVRAPAPYDLITCMLGTISHFGYVDERARFEGCRLAVQRLASLLSEHGRLVIGSWAKDGRGRIDALTIYSESERDRLARWTPDKEMLTEVFAEYGLHTQFSEQIDGRLDVYFLAKSNGA